MTHAQEECEDSEGDSEPPGLGGREYLAVVYTVYGDESSDEQAKRIFLVMGVFGDSMDWASATLEWLKLTKGEEVHAAEWEHAGRQKELAQLCRVICNSNLLGFAAAMDLVDYDELFESALPHLPHFVCFIEVIEELTKVAAQSIPPDKVEFIFHRKPVIENDAASLYDYMLNVPEWKYRDVPADKIAFASLKTPGVQIADLMALETRKWLDNLATGYNSPRRPAFAKLFDNKKVLFRKYERSYFEGMKKHILETGSSMQSYHDWRRKNKMRDTTATRIKYHFHRDIQNRGNPVE